MYCPKCMNDTLKICSRGVVNIVINKKQQDSGRSLYSLESSEKKVQSKKDLIDKIEEFFKWYSGFQNIEPITLVELVTSDVECEDGCRGLSTGSFSVVDIIISRKELVEILKAQAEKLELDIKLYETT